MKYINLLILCSISNLIAAENIDINERIVCKEHNKIYLEKEKKEHLQCNVNKKVFEKYKDMIKKINKLNNDNKEIGELELPHPYVYMNYLKNEMKKVDRRTYHYKSLVINYNSFETVYKNIKNFLPKLNEKKYKELKTSKSVNTKKELSEELIENYDKYIFYRDLKSREKRDLYYTTTLFYKNLSKNNNIKVEKESRNILDLYTIKKDIKNELNKEYSKYISDKNRYNKTGRQMIGDDYKLFKEYEETILSLGEKLNNIKMSDLNNKKLVYLNLKKEILEDFIGRIRVYRPILVNFNNKSVKNQVDNILKSRYRIEEIQRRTRFFYKNHKTAIKYKNQYLINLYNRNYILYNYILRNNLKEKGFFVEVKDWFY